MKNSLGTVVGAAVLAAALLAPAQTAAQNPSDEVLHKQLKLGLARTADTEGEGPRGFVIPPQTGAEHYGFHVETAGITKPTTFPTETWIRVICTGVDPRVKWERKFGSSLVRIHAFVYARNADLIVNTADTDAADEGICDLSNPAATSYIEVPRTPDVGVVSLSPHFPRSGQRVEMASKTDRAIPLP